MEIYTNKLDLSKALQDKDLYLTKIFNKYSYSGDLTKVQNLGLYVYPDGKLINLFNHEDIDKFLISENAISIIDNNEFKDVKEGSQFMDACNCVRVRWSCLNDLAWIMLPKENLTEIQYRIITKIIDTILYTKSQLIIFSLDNTYSKNFSSEYFDETDEIIKEIHRFYN